MTVPRYNSGNQRECRSGVGAPSGVAASDWTTSVRTKFTPTQIPSQTDIAWAAGFFDGEGCCQIWKTTTGVYHPVCCITQRDNGPLLEIQKIWGGTVKSIRSSNSPRPCYQLWLKHATAIRFLEDIRPYTRVKSAAIDVLFESRRLQPGAGRKASPELLSQMQELRDHLKRVNRGAA